MNYLYRSALGQDSHRFCAAGEEGRPLRLAGLVLEGPERVAANSDGDVLFHAVTNAVSGLTGVNILGERADALCRAGRTDSRVYLEEALRHLGALELVHLSVSIEAARPKLEPHIGRLRAALAAALGLPLASVGLTATTGEGLSGMGRGEGIQVLCVLSAREALPEACAGPEPPGAAGQGPDADSKGGRL